MNIRPTLLFLIPYLLLAIPGLNGQDIVSSNFNFDQKGYTLQIKAPAKKVEVKAVFQNDTKEVPLRDEIGYLPISKEKDDSDLLTVDYKGELFLLKYEYEVLVKNQPKTKSKYKLYHISKAKNNRLRTRHIPLWLSIIPPLIAILLALLFREVTVALFLGIWSGAFISGGMRIDSIYYFLTSIWEVLDKYILQALTDSGHLAIIIFSLLIGGMVAIISRNGGMAGVVEALSKYARTERSAQFITWLMGVAIFFDDYANTLIVGNTMRSVTDKFKISREKLAYIVDSTAAPVAAIAFITTWIGAELGYIEDGISILNNFPGNSSPYSIFLESLRYSFYPVLALGFILILIYTGREFGPMLKAEKRARSTGQVSPALTPDEDEPNMEDLSPVKGAPKKWFHAVIPVAAVIIMTIFGLVDTGLTSCYNQLIDEGIQIASPSWSNIWAVLPQLPELANESNPSFLQKVGTLIGNSDSYAALLWASLTGVILAIAITVINRTMNLFLTMHSMVTGFKTMLPALIILTLAWSLAITTKELHTATYLAQILEGNISPYLMPTIIFILASLIAFSTGSSWSTMAILYPIAIPTTWIICQGANFSDPLSLEILYNVIAVVLAASVLGDHCSPISDTTILSSLASDCNHIDHVRTQLPYAATVGVVSLLAGTISTILGGGWGVCTMTLLAGFAILYFIVKKFGSKI